MEMFSRLILMWLPYFTWIEFTLNAKTKEGRIISKGVKNGYDNIK